MKLTATALLLGLILSTPALAGSRLSGGGGLVQLEGAGGGLLVPWALISGNGTREQWSPSAFYSQVKLPQYSLTSRGLALAIHDRVELSWARQELDIGNYVAGQALQQNIAGLKMRLAGHVFSDQDVLWPQLSVGAFYKRGDPSAWVPPLLGARRSSDSELYLAASKMWLEGLLGRTTLLNGTLRYTRANQFGLFGFGGDKNEGKALCIEAGAAIFLTDRWMVGGEYRQKPDNLSAAREEAAMAVSVSWLPVKYVTVTLAWSSFGNIVGYADQSGTHAQLQIMY